MNMGRTPNKAESVYMFKKRMLKLPKQDILGFWMADRKKISSGKSKMETAIINRELALRRIYHIAKNILR